MKLGAERFFLNKYLLQYFLCFFVLFLITARQQSYSFFAFFFSFATASRNSSSIVTCIPKISHFAPRRAMHTTSMQHTTLNRMLLADARVRRLHLAACLACAAPILDKE